MQKFIFGGKGEFSDYQTFFFAPLKLVDALESQQEISNFSFNRVVGNICQWIERLIKKN